MPSIDVLQVPESGKTIPELAEIRRKNKIPFRNQLIWRESKAKIFTKLRRGDALPVSPSFIKLTGVLVNEIGQFKLRKCKTLKINE